MTGALAAEVIWASIMTLLVAVIVTAFVTWQVAVSRETGAARLDEGARLAVDCYELGGDMFDSAEGSKAEERVLEKMFDRGCWP